MRWREAEGGGGERQRVEVEGEAESRVGCVWREGEEVEGGEGVAGVESGVEGEAEDGE